MTRGTAEPDGGAAGADGTTEAGLNLLVAQKLNNLLLQSDIKTVMTRTTNEGIYDPSAKNITEKKRTDMRKRREIQSSVGADLFISIHMNQFEQSKYHGAQVVYDGKTPRRSGWRNVSSPPCAKGWTRITTGRR